MSVGTTAAVVGGAALVGGAASVVGGAMTASATRDAGQAQADAARAGVALSQQALNEQIQFRADAISLAKSQSAMTPEEAASINNLLTTKSTALNASLSSISQQQDQVNAMAPDVKAAGSNLFNLLTGGAAATLAPIQALRDRQRNQLTNQLQSQMGPGFMTSSAGIEALTKFDESTAVTMSQAQQSAIQTIGSQYASLSGESMQGQSTITGQTGEAYGRATLADQTVLQADQSIAQRQVGATLGAESANPIGFSGPTQATQFASGSAGLPFGGQAAMGSTIAGVGGGVTGLGGTIISAQNQTNLNNTIAGLYGGGAGGFGGYQGSAAYGGANLTGNLSPSFGSTISGSQPGFSVGRVAG